MGYFRENLHTKQKTSRKNPSTAYGGSPRTERSPLPCGHLPTPWGVTLFKGGLYASLQTPYEIKLPTCTRKHLNINITDTGKGNYRRWQAPGGQRGKRANSAGRFRHGCTRKLLLSGKSAGRCGHRLLHIPNRYNKTDCIATIRSVICVQFPIRIRSCRTSRC